MALMFGRFEVQSEISKSETATIYKALDPQSNQVVALKTQRLAPLGERAAAFLATLMAEGELAQSLVGQNIAQLYGAGEIEGQFCASMEYLQGKSVATMLARNEGFSIWDLLDIARQVCAALEAAAKLGVVHSSLEPDKIVVQWDGLVKIAGYGISNMSLIGAETGNGLGRLMPYCSPEQIRGEAMDQRSNLFTLGAILYEMVAGRKAFDAEDPVALVNQIENETPVEPIPMNGKMQPGVVSVIMKALAKDPADRYATARDLVADLEECKEPEHKAPAAPAKKAVSVKTDVAAKAAASMKFVTAAASAGASASLAATNLPKPAARPAASSSKPAAPSARAGAGASPASDRPCVDSSVGPGLEAGSSTPPPVMSAAAPPQEEKAHAGGASIDPMMAQRPGQPGSGAAPRSFSEMDELPPLKDPVFEVPLKSAPPAEPPVFEPTISARLSAKKTEDKPKIQPRELAQKAIKEVSTIPPSLLLFSILGAIAVILVVAVAMFFHVRSEDDGLTVAPQAVKTVSAPPQSAPAPLQPAAPQVPAQPVSEPQPNLTLRQMAKRAAKVRPAPAPVPVVIPGMALIDSTPQGVQFELDGKSDPSWVTPFSVTGLAPGKHLVSASKPGYGSEVRFIDVVSNGKTSVVFHLSPVNALVVVTSTPAGADISLDGKPTHKVTPAQFAVEKGTHTVAVRKQGYLDETTTAELGPGQNFQFAPALKALGDSDAIRTVGRFKKLFGNGGDSTAGMGTVSIRTKPKGAQVVINQRIMDKMSPLDVMMGPGNYVVDITLPGFKPVHKVINVEKDGKVAIDETLERE